MRPARERDATGSSADTWNSSRRRPPHAERGELRLAIRRYIGVHLIAFGTSSPDADHERLSRGGFQRCRPRIAAPDLHRKRRRPRALYRGARAAGRDGGRPYSVLPRTPELVWQQRWLAIAMALQRSPPCDLHGRSRGSRTRDKAASRAYRRSRAAAQGCCGRPAARSISSTRRLASRPWASPSHAAVDRRLRRESRDLAATSEHSTHPALRCPNVMPGTSSAPSAVTRRGDLFHRPGGEVALSA